jgi:hypothetical protein
VTPADPFEEHDEGRRERGGAYTWRDWQADGFRGPPPWRRGYRPWSLLLSLALAALVLAVVVIAASRT